jgi:hypothetical protein
VDLLLRRNYVSNIGKLSLSDAMLWRSSIDHGENHEPGKSRYTSGEINHEMKIDGQQERNMLTWDPQLENSIKYIIAFKQHGQGHDFRADSGSQENPYTGPIWRAGGCSS